METTDKWVAIVSKLNELTQDGSLSWTQTEVLPSTAKPFGTSATLAFLANYKDKAFRLVCDPGGTVQQGFFNIATPESYKLQIVDATGRVLWAVPDVVGLKDLFLSIKYQLAGVKDLLENLLSEGTKKPKS